MTLKNNVLTVKKEIGKKTSDGEMPTESEVFGGVSTPTQVLNRQRAEPIRGLNEETIELVFVY